ncbi:hypothetical protein CORC01_08355 [Colletotrichum orchidophilum]|uniref:Uncharacterized protein n=1 Tax=Colletotrichum orchidophilum TaxID=1209926 RepID=A0A1G4B4N8_9PEZI|nr:uncharacterized protein CORC01_08355 [Colletotrichum orchidophilum]OHE96283.1 hypothetical protein CORC01_08355 [Colletotrichum orchidophilum]
MAPNDKPWAKALLKFPGLDFKIDDDAPLFNRRLNSAYLKMFANKKTHPGNTAMLKIQEHIASRGNVFFRRVIELSLSGSHTKRGALYVATLTDLAEDSRLSASWNGEVQHDSLILVMDIIVQARIQYLNVTGSTNDKEPPRIVGTFIATLDEWIAVIDAGEQKAATASDTRPPGNEFSLPYRPNPAKASESAKPKQVKLAQEIRSPDGNKRRIEEMKAKIRDLESNIEDHRSKKESLETAHETLREELVEAQNARRRIW